VHTATADPLVGRTLEGRYRIVERIARGGMSTVYAAVDERLDRLVAVKVMSAALSADPAFSDRFAREARAAARLSHLNTVSVYDQGTDTSAGTHVFLVMELVEGRTLRDLLRERGRLEPAEAVSIMEPVLTALAAAHRAGLVHRDVKPENILLSDEGVVKVADFGLARAVESDDAATRTGLMMGTVAYCSPEQISKGRADPRSDVYSAGVVFFELLTGAPPYHGESAMNVAYQHVHSRVPAPSSRVRGIPSEIDELIVAATDSDPAARPADAGAFLAALADVRAALALPVMAVPPRPRVNGAGGLGGRHVLDPRADRSTTQVVGPGAHDTSVVPRERPRPGAPARRSGPPPPIVTPPPRRPRKQVSAQVRRRRRNLIVLLVVLLLGVGAGYGGWWFASGRYARIPNVTGQSESAAIRTLRAAGYQVSNSVNLAYSEAIPTGDVISTDPSIGSRVPKGRTLHLTVSKGQERFTLPSVVNDTEAQARQALSQIPVQVSPTTSTQSSLTVPQGKVMGTTPPAGTKVKRNQIVTILISSGPPLVNVPDIAQGTPLDDAKNQLETAGFKTTVTQDFNDTVPNNTVISINPTGQAPQGSTITIDVSKGPQFVKVPKIDRGTPVADAEAALTAAGLQYQVQSVGIGDGSAVLALSPDSGTKVRSGSTVIIYAI